MIRSFWGVASGIKLSWTCASRTELRTRAKKTQFFKMSLTLYIYRNFHDSIPFKYFILRLVIANESQKRTFDSDSIKYMVPKCRCGKGLTKLKDDERRFRSLFSMSPSSSHLTFSPHEKSSRKRSESQPPRESDAKDSDREACKVRARSQSEVLLLLLHSV